MTMRLYRGLKEPYRPDKVGSRQKGPAGLFGTDFSDDHLAALQYAQGDGSTGRLAAGVHGHDIRRG